MKMEKHTLRTKIKWWQQRRLPVCVIVIIISTCFLSGCRTKKIYIPVERKVTETTMLRDTVVRIELVPYRDSVSITPTEEKDTISFLENPYAYSYASLIDGLLNHSLGIKKGAVSQGKVQVKTIHIVDSIPYPVEVKGDTVTIYKMYGWQKYLLWSGIVAHVFVLLYIGVKLRNK